MILSMLASSVFRIQIQWIRNKLASWIRIKDSTKFQEKKFNIISNLMNCWLMDIGKPIFFNGLKNFWIGFRSSRMRNWLVSRISNSGYRIQIRGSGSVRNIYGSGTLQVWLAEKFRRVPGTVPTSFHQFSCSKISYWKFCFKGPLLAAFMAQYETGLWKQAFLVRTIQNFKHR